MRSAPSNGAASGSTAVQPTQISSAKLEQQLQMALEDNSKIKKELLALRTDYAKYKEDAS